MFGFLAGLVALGFNFLLRLGGLAAFPPESALGAFLAVIPASIEEPMVQRFGDLAGQLGLLTAILIAATVYGAVLVVFDRYVIKRLSGSFNRFEVLLTLGLVPWALFGVALFPLAGNSLFGVGAPFASPGVEWIFPFTLLMVQGVFALVLSFSYSISSPSRGRGEGPVLSGSRREFIERGALGVLALAATVIGLTRIGQLFPTELQPTGGNQPIDLQSAPAIFSDSRLARLVQSEVTPNDSFYRVAIDIFDPSVDVSSWSLMVDGLVNTPKRYSIEQVQSLPQTSQYTTFECVSNDVNGNLISNAKWAGVRLSDLFSDVGGLSSDASYVVFRSVDGYSVGIPIAKAMMPNSILAYSMNDQTLPVGHGYPLRGVIPGLYGMMSAKWVNQISVVGSVYEGYWQTRGWTTDATIFTEAFIAVPESGGASLSQNEGSVLVGGYAFAGDRGISKVEVSFDNGRTWEEAQLKKPLSNLTWALWAYDWHPPAPGQYQVLARATDGLGALQTSTVAGNFPNGATGYAAALVQVTN